MIELTNKEKAILTYKEIEKRKSIKLEKNLVKNKQKEKDILGYEIDKYYNRYIRQR